MRRLSLVLVVLVAIALVGVLTLRPGGDATAASASPYGMGIGDQFPTMFSARLYQRLEARYSRLVVPWDWYKSRYYRANTDAWIAAALHRRARPLIAFNHSAKHPRRLPSVRQYRTAFKKFRRRYPRVRDLSPWNEVNHKSQPTWRNPKRAAQYYNVVRSACRGCTVVAADLLDQGGEQRYVKTFLKTAKGSPRLWGLHNYSDVNRRKRMGRQTDKFMRTVRGQVWITETGGIVRFPPAYPFDVDRAADRTRKAFALADRYSTKRAGYRSRVTRLYLYQWTGSKKNTVRFDAGITGPDGKARPAYTVVKRFFEQAR